MVSAEGGASDESRRQDLEKAKKQNIKNDLQTRDCLDKETQLPAQSPTKDILTLRKCNIYLKLPSFFRGDCNFQLQRGLPCLCCRTGFGCLVRRLAASLVGSRMCCLRLSAGITALG